MKYFDSDLDQVDFEVMQQEKILTFCRVNSRLDLGKLIDRYFVDEVNRSRDQDEKHGFNALHYKFGLIETTNNKTIIKESWNDHQFITIPPIRYLLGQYDRLKEQNLNLNGTVEIKLPNEETEINRILRKEFVDDMKNKQYLISKIIEDLKEEYNLDIKYIY